MIDRGHALPLVAHARQLGIADPAMRRLIVARVARLEVLVLRIEKSIAAVIAASSDLATREALLRTAPGVGLNRPGFAGGHGL